MAAEVVLTEDDPALARWTDGLELRHMLEFIASAVDDRKKWCPEDTDEDQVVRMAGPPSR